MPIQQVWEFDFSDVPESELEDYRADIGDAIHDIAYEWAKEIYKGLEHPDNYSFEISWNDQGVHVAFTGTIELRPEFKGE